MKWKVVICFFFFPVVINGILKMSNDIFYFFPLSHMELLFCIAAIFSLRFVYGNR